MDIEKYFSEIQSEIERLKAEQAVRSERIKRLAEELGLAVDADLPRKVGELRSKTEAEIAALEREIQSAVEELERQQQKTQQP